MNTELIITTPQQLREIITECLNIRPVEIKTEEPTKKYAYSIREGANEFHVSTVTFQDWKNRGLVKYIQQGRKLIIDLPGTMELLKNQNKRR